MVVFAFGLSLRKVGRSRVAPSNQPYVRHRGLPPCRAMAACAVGLSLRLVGAPPGLLLVSCSAVLLAWIALDPFCTRICRVCLGDAHQAECSRRHVSCCVLRCFDGHLAITRPIVSPLSPFIFGLLTLFFRGLRVLLVLCAGFQRKMSTFRHNFPFDRLTEFGVKMRLIRVLSADVVLDSSRRGLLTT